MAHETESIVLPGFPYRDAGGPLLLDGKQQIDARNTAEIKRILEEALVWPTQLMAEQLKGKSITFTQPELVIVDSTTIVDGELASRAGPFYNRRDGKVYIDPTFFENELLKLQADNDIWAVTVAYVILHEIGHHIQHTIGPKLGTTPGEENIGEFIAENPILIDEPNLFIIAMELQADCISGMLLHAEDLKRQQTIEDGDENEVQEDAANIGDDVLMINSHVPPMPENMTHGTAVMRRNALRLGLTLTDISQVPKLQHFLNIAKKVYEQYLLEPAMTS